MVRVGGRVGPGEAMAAQTVREAHGAVNELPSINEEAEAGSPWRAGGGAQRQDGPRGLLPGAANHPARDRPQAESWVLMRS